MSDDSSHTIPAMATTSLSQVLHKDMQRGTNISSGGGGQKNRVVGLIVMDIGGEGGDDDGVDKGKSQSHIKQNRKHKIFLAETAVQEVPIQVSVFIFF